MHGQVSEADLPDRAETWAPENVSSARRVFWPQLSADKGRPSLMTGKLSRSPASGQSLIGVVTRTDVGHDRTGTSLDPAHLDHSHDERRRG